MLIPSRATCSPRSSASLSRRVNANSQLIEDGHLFGIKLIKKGEC